MPQGFVTTARGEVLNMDQLKTLATMPIAEKKQPGRTVEKKTYSKRQPLNVRGYVPQQGEAKIPELSDEVKSALSSKNKKISSKTIPASYSTTGTAESLADLTGIRVNKPSQATKEKVKQAMENEQRPAEVASEALDEILGDLQQNNPEAMKAASEEEKTASEEEKIVRRTRSKKD